MTLTEINKLPFNKDKNDMYVLKWIKQYDEQGKESFYKKNRGRNKNGKSGRPKKEIELSSDEKVLIQEKLIEVLRKENEELKKEYRLGKEVKQSGNEFKIKPTQDIFRYIHKLKDQVKISIELLCKYYEVSRSGYYKWVKTIPNRQKREEQDYADFVVIKKTWLKHNKKHGYLRINMDLKNDEGIVMNPKKIYRLMKKYGIRAEIRKVNPYLGIMQANKEHNYFENKLDRQFDVKEPDTVFVTDITYLIYGNQRYYLSVVKELCTREIVAWKLSRGLSLNLSLEIIDQLVKKYGKKKLKNTMIHSDQGVHYTNPSYVNKLKELNIIQSMSRRGNCLDNAKMETFFGHFKDECDYQQAKDFYELYKIVDNYMRYYNCKRYQWTLNKMAPTQYRNHLKAA
ncbi:IS3 family transposase [Mycoplasmatota bacterium]|nr:IS3 family transposase [Mycoplasmatota bacterium]